MNENDEVYCETQRVNNLLVYFQSDGQGIIIFDPRKLISLEEAQKEILRREEMIQAAKRYRG